MNESRLALFSAETLSVVSSLKNSLPTFTDAVLSVCAVILSTLTPMPATFMAKPSAIAVVFPSSPTCAVKLTVSALKVLPSAMEMSEVVLALAKPFTTITFKTL